MTIVALTVMSTNDGCRMVRRAVRLGLVVTVSPLFVKSLDVGRPFVLTHRVPIISGLVSVIRLVALIPVILLRPLKAMWVYRVPV